MCVFAASSHQCDEPARRLNSGSRFARTIRGFSGGCSMRSWAGSRCFLRSILSSFREWRTLLDLERRLAGGWGGRRRRSLRFTATTGGRLRVHRSRTRRWPKPCLRVRRSGGCGRNGRSHQRKCWRSLAGKCRAGYGRRRGGRKRPGASATSCVGLLPRCVHAESVSNSAEPGKAVSSRSARNQLPIIPASHLNRAAITSYGYSVRAQFPCVTRKSKRRKGVTL